MEKETYPLTHRRIRAQSHTRELSAEVHLSHRQFILPLFAEEGMTANRSINGLPGVEVYAESLLRAAIEEAMNKGINKFLLFPIPAAKREGNFDFSFAARLVQVVKQRFGDAIWLAVDLCLCSYTTHGHCGVLNTHEDRLLNHETVPVLVRYALELADAGADCIAPSDMMDGRIGAIRKALNKDGFDEVVIMSYAAKFSSQWYGPFRDACHSAPQAAALMHRKSYQISPFHPGDAIASSLRDEAEGADILMVKPAGLYTDVIASLRAASRKPIAAYHVSGEYAAIEALAAQGLLERAAAHIEVWAALRRSGAGIIISYAAIHAQHWIAVMEM